MRDSKADAILDELAQRLFVLEDKMEKMHVTLQLATTLLEAIRQVVVLAVPLDEGNDSRDWQE
jgi:hypothetical protein